MSGLESVEVKENHEMPKRKGSNETSGDVQIAGPTFIAENVNEAICDFDKEFLGEEQAKAALLHEQIIKLSNEAKGYYASGNFDAAYETYWQILQMDVFDTSVLFDCYKNLGNIFLKDGDFAEAEELFDKACTIDPQSDALLVNYGVLEIQRKNLERARERFRGAININSNNDSAWVGLALVHREFGDVDLSWANLERALDSNKANETALMIALDWGIRDSRLEKISKRLSTYISEVSDSIELRLSLAKVLFCSGNFVRAMEEANHVLKMQPNNEDASRLIQVIENEVMANK